MIETYNKIEWSFFENILTKLGFDLIWVANIMIEDNPPWFLAQIL